MARRNLFNRLTSAVGRLVKRVVPPAPGPVAPPEEPREPPRRPPEPPREPPRQPPREPPEAPIGPGGGNPWRSAWNAEVPRKQQNRISSDTGYSRNEIFQHHVELFLSIGGIAEEPRDEQLRLWSLYLESLVAGIHGKRNDRSNVFWSEMGLDPRDFDWEDWRDGMGYSRRSR